MLIKYIIIGLVVATVIMCIVHVDHPGYFKKYRDESIVKLYIMMTFLWPVVIIIFTLFLIFSNKIENPYN